jgi:transposase
MVPQLKRHEVQTLLAAGLPQRDVALHTGVSLRTVKRIAKEAPVTTLTTQPSNTGRPSKTDGFRGFVRDTLEQEPHLRSVELLRRAKHKGYTGGKSAFYAMVKAVRPPKARFTYRFDGLPGEFSQHDFGEVRVVYDSGQAEVIQFFASRLKWSRFAVVDLVPDQTAESIIRCMALHLVAFGGVPLRCVFDRPKTIAVKWRKDGKVTQWNRHFGDAMVQLGFVAELCWPHSPQQKGSVENLVGWVKNSFFKQRRFVDREDLEQQLAEWLEQINHERPSRATQEIPETRRQQELERFRPLRTLPEDLALRQPVVVSPMATVRLHNQSYAMPPEAAGLGGTAHLFADRVRFVVGKHRVEHLRQEGPGLVLGPDERAARLAAVSGKRGRTYLKRQHLLEIGPSAERFLTELIHRRPWDWFPIVHHLHDLLDSYGPERMHDAFEAAVDADRISIEGVLQALFQPSLFRSLA